MFALEPLFINFSLTTSFVPTVDWVAVFDGEGNAIALDGCAQPSGSKCLDVTSVSFKASSSLPDFVIEFSDGQVASGVSCRQYSSSIEAP